MSLRSSGLRSRTCLRVLAARCARSFAFRLPSENQRARGRPGARCTRGLAGCVAKGYAAHEHTGSAVNTPASPTQWLYGLYAIVLVTLLFVTPSLSGSVSRLRTRRLHRGVGPKRFRRTLTSALVSRCLTSTAPCPSFATMAHAPLVGQDSGSYGFDLPDGASDLFLREGLDSFLVICPSGYFVAGILVASAGDSCAAAQRATATPLWSLDNIVLLLAGVSIAVAWLRLMILDERPGFSGGNLATKNRRSRPDDQTGVAPYPRQHMAADLGPPCNHHASLDHRANRLRDAHGTAKPDEACERGFRGAHDSHEHRV